MNAKKITIQDIAISAKVSKSTVSRVLNNSTPVDEDKRKAVLLAIKRLKFKPNVFARTLAGGNSMTLGIVTQNIGSPFYDSITQGVIRSLSGTDYSPIFADGRWEPAIEKAAIETLIDRRVAGIIMVGGNLESAILKECSQEIPLVLVARKLKGWEQRSIFMDNVDAARSATQYLIEQGHRQIAHIKGIGAHQDAIDRFRGYQLALSEAGIKFDAGLVVDGDFSSRSGILAMESLLLRGKPFSAVFCGNDEMAQGARLSLYRRAIRVPEDISIIGFDDQPHSAFMTPPLTTIAQPALSMGETAAEMLIHILQNKEFKSKLLPAKLVIRESVARI